MKVVLCESQAYLVSIYRSSYKPEAKSLLNIMTIITDHKHFKMHSEIVNIILHREYENQICLLYFVHAPIKDAQT